MRAKISAPVVSAILIACLLLIIAGATAGFLYVHGLLVQKADETARVTTESANSNEKINALKQEQAELKANAGVEKKVQDMLASNLQYTYQDQVVTALKAIASSANVSITNIDFTSAVAATGTSTPPPTSAAGGAAAPITIPGGVTMKQVSITLASPLPYDNLILFLHYIEQNTMSMQVSKVSITGTGVSKDGKTLVSCDSLTLGVYMK